MGLWPLEIFLLLQCGNRLSTAESDVYRRQILTSKVNHRTVIIKLNKVTLTRVSVYNHSIITPGLSSELSYHIYEIQGLFQEEKNS